MLEKFNHFISSIGTKKTTSASGLVKYKTFNWILFLTLLSSVLWSLILFTIKKPLAASLPLSMVFIIPGLFYLLHKGRGFHFVLNIFIVLLLLFPLIIQELYGGFINSGAVIIWSILAPITSLLFKKGKVAKAVFGCFVLSLTIAVFAEFFLQPLPINENQNQLITQLVLNVIAVTTILYFPVLQFSNELLHQNKIIETQGDFHLCQYYK